MLNLVLFGPPGSGKGTQSNNLIKDYHLIHLSTGDLLRNEIAEGTELGLKAKEIMAEGLLVPDKVVIGMIKKKLENNKAAKGFIFDGFPRTVAQAEALDEALTSMDAHISGMIELKVGQEELEKRLLLRGTESDRPDDADIVVIRKRINEYISKTVPVAEYYKQQGKLRSVSGMGKVEDIFDSVKELVNSL